VKNSYKIGTPGSGQLVVFEDFDPNFNTPRVVHVQDLNGCAPDWGEANELRSVEAKMVGPMVAPRVEEAREVARLGINPGQVRALVQVATVACEREIAVVIGAAVLFGNDVLHVMFQVAMFLAQAAVLTAIASPAADEVARGRVHCY
jgi:hypothetical protein